MTQENTSVRIAVDAMGGDFAPAEIVAGAVLAARQGGVQIALVGDPDKVNAELVKHNAKGLPITPVASEGVIMEGEPPALALRQKPKASILVATGMVKKGFVDACVSMGSTGAAMAAAVVVLGVIEGIERPCLGGPIVGLAPRTVILDVGTNVDCRPSQLVSFAVIGDVFARQLWGIERPRVALLSVGSEVGKGNKQVKETTDLMAAAGLNFIGNVEGYDLPTGKADVVVCDGFVGNVVMKLTEGLGAAIAERLRHQKLNQAAREVFEATNVAETYGGGPILGVNGVSVVGHGRAKADAVAKAIGTAKMSVEKGLVSQLNQRLAAIKPRTQG